MMRTRETNSLGFAIGQRRWSDGSPLMRVALNAERQIVSIENVRRGFDCNCVCACCEENLSAKQGEEREWHFAHRPGPVHCSKRQWLSLQAAEFFKRILPSKELLLPHVVDHRVSGQLVRVERFVRCPSYLPLSLAFDMSFQRARPGSTSEFRRAPIAVLLRLPWTDGCAEPDWAQQEQRAIEVDLRQYFSVPDDILVDAVCRDGFRAWRWPIRARKSRQELSLLKSSSDDARWRRFWLSGRRR